tara:strand:- start:921 stop:1535 length:615 start_codon:yes stop_codon:yes gene_type:complete
MLADRIAQIALLTNTTADLLTGSVRLEPPTDTGTANSNPNRRRRRLSTGTGIDPWTTTTVDESACNGTLSRIYLDIDFTSEDPAEQARFIQAFEALANDVGTAPIDDVDGAGSIAYVCVPWLVVENQRETVDAPSQVAADTELPWRIITVFSAAAAFFLLLFTALLCYFCAGAGAAQDSDEENDPFNTTYPLKWTFHGLKSQPY